MVRHPGFVPCPWIVKELLTQPFSGERLRINSPLFMDFIGSSKPRSLPVEAKFSLADQAIDKILSAGNCVFTQLDSLFNNYTIFLLVY